MALLLLLPKRVAAHAVSGSAESRSFAHSPGRNPVFSPCWNGTTSDWRARKRRCTHLTASSSRWRSITIPRRLAGPCAARDSHGATRRSFEFRDSSSMFCSTACTSWERRSAFSCTTRDSSAWPDPSAFSSFGLSYAATARLLPDVGGAPIAAPTAPPASWAGVAHFLCVVALFGARYVYFLLS